ncbi:MAG TPA: polysaccharide deacetylase family protein [Bacteroidales bacterium]|nr:polysaccharide deacetylase family protein [Bacteroidales bacterium]
MGLAYHPVHSPRLLRRLLPKQLHWQGDPGGSVLYLTFDDGPVPGATPRVLDILKSFDARATFFCVGDNARKYPDLLQRLKEEGHAAGNHTFSHLNGWRTATPDYLEDVRKAQALIGGSLFRPPYGRIRPSQVKAIAPEMDIVLWTVLSWDFHPEVSAGQCLDNVLKFSGSGSVVVFHDSPRCLDKLNRVLPPFLEEFRAKGFTFEPLTPDRLRNARSDGSSVS